MRRRAAWLRSVAWDLLLAPVALLGLLALRKARRLGNDRLRLVPALYDRIGVYPVVDQYYEPMIRPSRHLRTPLEGARDLPGLDLREEEQVRLLRQLRFGDELTRIPFADPGTLDPFYDNGNYVQGDAEALYSLLRHRPPRRMVEIGSGMSTRFAVAAIRANESHGSPPCDHVCVEPYEMPWLEDLGVSVLRDKVEDVDLELFTSLEAGDVLFVDSSHVVRPQGDVLHIYQRILPRLAAGVLVHVHDIFTPRDYPEAWIMNRRLLWNEQYLLEALLAESTRFEVLLALNHVWHVRRDEVGAAFPVLAEHGGMPGSFWIRRT